MRMLQIKVSLILDIDEHVLKLKRACQSLT